MAAYTDKELELATQIAYAELGNAYDSLKGNPNNDRTVFTLKELRDEAKRINPKINLDNLKGLSEEQLNTWSISQVHDKNDDNGFYACVVDTGDGNAILAYRGSESMGTTEEQLRNLQHDWIDSDLGILNADGDTKTTNQYIEARNFLSENKDLINGYDNIYLTGHSLGGNLAEFSTIVSDDCGVGDNFERCVSFDGPGFSDEFIEHYADAISKNASKIDHYKWSIVGSILNDLPGENSMFIKVKNDAVKNPIGRHSTSSIDFDDNGNVQKGRQDFLAFIVEKFTKLTDKLPGFVGNTIAAIVAEGLMFGFKNPELTIAILVVFAVSNPLITGAIIGTVVVILVFEYVGELIGWVVDKFVDFVCKIASDIKEWAKEKYEEFCAQVKQTTKDIVNWYKSNFDEDYKAAKNYLANNSIIKLHTDDLRSLASRLISVNKKLDALDSRLNNLYSKVKWTDLWTLMNADFKIASSFKLTMCSAFLCETAERFEAVEKSFYQIETITMT